MLVTASPIGKQHLYAVDKLTELLVLAMSGRARIRVQGSFAASDDSEPEPDVSVLPLGAYLDDHPKAAHLLIEVADSSLRFDRMDKLRLYAEAGVPECWIVNLVDDVIEVYRDPSGDAYAAHVDHGRGARLSLLAFPDVTLAVDDILPPRR